MSKIETVKAAGYRDGQPVNDKEYKVLNGTYYDGRTPDAVVYALENARCSGSRVRFFYGHEDGRDWHEENDVAGRISRSMGPIKVPILLANSRSISGGAILDHCIVRLMVNGSEVYRHPSYTAGEFTISTPPATIGNTDMAAAGYTVGVYINGENHANFKTRAQAERWLSFMTGERMRK